MNQTPKKPYYYIYPRNDKERGSLLAYEYRDKIRYVPHWKQWLLWNTNHWEKDSMGGEFLLAQEMVENFGAEAFKIRDEEIRKLAVYAASKAGDYSTMSNMLKVARTDPLIARAPYEFDEEPMLLGVKNGVVDLSTGKFRAGQQMDCISKYSGVKYEEAVECPLFDASLEKVFEGNQDLIAFIWRAFGYCLTGLTKEQVFFFLYGTGNNGKSTIMETFRKVLGPYCQKAPNSLFKEDRSGRDPETAIARLLGCRVAVCTETEMGVSMAEARIKDLCGNDTLVGRELYGKHFEFTPTHKLWIYGNYEPNIRGADEGIWRRLLQIPFTAEIPKAERDTNILVKLETELPGILNKAIRGCLEWQQSGLRPPTVVRLATDTYREEEDEIGEFIDERCILSSFRTVVCKEIYHDFCDWMEGRGAGKYLPSIKNFNKRLKSKKLHMRKRGSAPRIWEGIALK